MVTIQVSEDTKIRLLKLAAQLQMKLGKKVSLDDAIRYLLKSMRNEDKLNSFYGCLRSEKVEEARKLLQELRDEEEKRLERLEKKSGI